MKKLFAAILLLVAAGAHADVVRGGNSLNRALANSLYCQLAGCTMTGALNVGASVAVTTGASGTYVSGSSSADEAAKITMANSNAIGTSALAQFTATADVSSVTMVAHGSGRVATRWGTALGGGAELLLASGNFLAIGTAGAGPVKIGTAGTLGMQMDASQNTTFYGLLNASGSTFRVAADFTDASSTALQAITGMSWVLPASTAANYSFRCEILYSQATAAVSDSFGIQAASLAPTNISAKGDVATSASASTFGNLPTLTTTTATAVVTFTPSAAATVFNATLTGMIENPSGVANTINVMVSQSTAGNLITIKRGSYCSVGH